MRPARTADNSGVLGVPNVKVRIEAQISISLWVSVTCYGKALPFTLQNHTVYQLQREGR